MAQNRKVELEIALKNAQSISDLETVIKDINKELKETAVGSESFNQLSELSKKANGSLGSVKDSLKEIGSEKQIQASLKLGEALAGSFAVANVASQAFGEKTQKNVQEVIANCLQLQTVIAGLKPITEAFSASNVKTFKTIITGFQESALGATLFGTTTRAALTATGIGLFIVALGTIVVYWEDISKVIGLAAEKQDSFFKTGLANLEAQKTLLSQYNEELNVQIKLLELAGNNEKAIFDIRKQQLLASLANEQIKQKLLEDQTNLLAKAYQIDKGRLDISKLTKDEFVTIGKLLEESGKNIEEAFKGSKKEFDETSKSIVNLKNQLAILNGEEKKFSDDTAKDFEKREAAFRKQAEEFVAAKDKEVSELVKSEEEIMAAEAARANAQDQYLKDEKARFEEERRMAQERIDAEDELNMTIQTKSDETTQHWLENNQTYLQNSAQFTQMFLDATNAVGQAITDRIAANIDGLQTEIDAITSQSQESVAIREGLEAQLADSQGARRDQLLAGIERETKKEQDLAAKKKKLMNDEIKAKNKLNETQWKLSLINATVNTALAVTNALAGPYPLSLIFAALAAVLGAVEIGVIADNKPEKIPTLARGGFTPNGSHIDETGERVAYNGVPVRLHENEWVAPRWMTEHPQFGSMIASLENARLGKPMATGGFSSAPTISETTFNGLTGDALTHAIQNARIFVSVQEINDAQTNVAVLESNGSF